MADGDEMAKKKITQASISAAAESISNQAMELIEIINDCKACRVEPLSADALDIVMNLNCTARICSELATSIITQLKISETQRRIEAMKRD